MMGDPKVSVLVTYYNDVEYVDQGIESIFRKSFSTIGIRILQSYGCGGY